MTTKKAKTTTKQYANKNPLEALRDIGGGVAKSVVTDLAKDSMKDLWSQFLGATEKKPQQQAGGELQEGQEINLSSLQKIKTPEAAPFVEAAIDYRKEILHGEKRISQEDRQVVETKIQEIVIELKRLTATSKQLQTEFKVVSTQQRIVNPGKYHLSFFEWLLAVVRTARLRVEDSAAWLAMFKSKKAKKQYWNMFKKHGTTFGLSNERVVATQTG